MPNAMMKAKDSIYGSLAECYITIGTRRYNFMSLTDFESKWEVKITEVKILGKVGMGHKAAGGKEPGVARRIITSRISGRLPSIIRKRGKCHILKSRFPMKTRQARRVGRQLSTGIAFVINLPLQSSRQGRKSWTRNFLVHLRTGICRKNLTNWKAIKHD